MSLELIIGPMFAGKSTEAVVRILDLKERGIPHCVFTSCHDTRYDSCGQSICSHSGLRLPALGVTELSSILALPQVSDASHIIIEEAQFFPELYTVVMELVEGKGKHVLVFGLDGDSERRPFGKILDLIPLADRYTKLRAECRLCGDGTAALFTKRISGGTGQVCVGGEDTYKPVCRKHYLEPTRH